MGADKACKDLDRKTPTVTNLTDGETILGNCQVDKDRKAVDNIQLTANLPDSQHDACNSDDPTAQTAVAAELPKPPVTFVDCCTNSTNCLLKVYRKSKVCRSNLSRATNVCFDFLSHVHVGSTDFDFSDVGRDSPKGLAVAVFPSSVTLDLQTFFPAFSTSFLGDSSFRAVVFVIFVNTSM